MYRLLNVNDGHEYAALVHDAYQADGELGIDFAAVTLPEEKLIRGLILNPTYGLFIEGRLVSAITLRMPWVKKPGPYGVPHLGWVSTRPEEKHKGYARKLFFLLEEQILKEELRTGIRSWIDENGVPGYRSPARKEKPPVPYSEQPRYPKRNKRK